jgi:hypothetical protein
VLGTRVAAIAHVQGDDLAGLGIHSDPHPLLVGFLLHKAGEFIGFHLQPLYQHIAGTGDGLDMEMIRQGLEALDQKTQEPLEGDAHRPTDAEPRNALHQQAFDKTPLSSGDEVLLAALDKLAATVLAVMVLFAVMDVTVFLVLGGFALRTHLSDEHGFC